MSRPPELQPMVPGQKLANDWFDGVIPANVVAGEGTRIDSSHCFFHFRSEQPEAVHTGAGVTIWRSSLSVGETGRIVLGDHCYLCNASLVSELSITLGDRVVLSPGVTIADSDFHPINPVARIADTIALAPGGGRSARPPRTPQSVTIGSDVWIGPNATILKGVTIGDGAHVAPGAVVVSDVAGGAHVAGNPAKAVEVG